MWEMQLMDMGYRQTIQSRLDAWPNMPVAWGGGFEKQDGPSDLRFDGEMREEPVNCVGPGETSVFLLGFDSHLLLSILLPNCCDCPTFYLLQGSREVFTIATFLADILLPVAIIFRGTAIIGSELGLTADSKQQVRLDSVGVFWICFASAWTLLLVCGMAFLASKRHMPMIRIRGLGLSLCAIALLHLYWISVQLDYVLGVFLPAESEYWIMGTWLPFGIALFHASNTRFLHVAKAQKRYAQHASVLDAPVQPRTKSGDTVGRFRKLDHTTKMVVLVGLGMVFQSFMTVFMYLISRKWHSSWGIPGTEAHGTEALKKLAMGSSWEWWPSVCWQFFWAWAVAPVILWKSRTIHDTHGWRIQTIGCSMANLHSTPMWLAALNLPAFERINKYWAPSQWIAISVLVMEILTVFLPCWEVFRHQSLRQETLETIAQWEFKTKNRKGNKSLSSGSTVVGSVKTGWKSTHESVISASNESILTMGALEYVLERNPEPLQQYSALRDFSGEKIAFLTSVAEWKSSLPALVRNANGNVPGETRRKLVQERFSRALRIYAEFISARDAMFQINISSGELKKLESVFERPARIMYGEKCEVDPAAPFNVPQWVRPSSCHASEREEERKKEREKEVVAEKAGAGHPVQYWGNVPEGFDETVFDDAEKSIKYLVLTNTWAKFVRNRRSSSADSLGSTEAGQSTVAPTWQ